MKPVVIVQNCPAEGPGTIVDYLDDRRIPYSIVHSYQHHQIPSATEVSSVINLGCPLSVTEFQQHEFLRQVYSLVAESVRLSVPYLGICFGGQILARALGARVEANPVKEIGIYQVRTTADGLADPLLSGFGESFRVAQWHGDTFRIPFGSALLVEGDDCKNQAFRVGKAVGLQFHLETTAADMEAWCDSYPQELAETGKSRDQVVAQAKESEPELRALNYRLLDNFFAMNKN
jgi:GMP synthase (glutamine-hydrolysing)